MYIANTFKQYRKWQSWCDFVALNKKELFECPIEYFFEEKTLSENEAEKNECQKIKTIVEENNFRLEDLSKAIEIMKVLQKG